MTPHEQKRSTVCVGFRIEGKQEGKGFVSPDEQLSKLRSPQSTSNATSSSGLAVLDEEVDFLKSASQSWIRSSCSHRTVVSPVQSTRQESKMFTVFVSSQLLGCESQSDMLEYHKNQPTKRGYDYLQNRLKNNSKGYRLDDPPMKPAEVQIGTNFPALT